DRGAAETLQGGLCRDRQCVGIKRGVRIHDFLKRQSVKISEISARVQKEHSYESPCERLRNDAIRVANLACRHWQIVPAVESPKCRENGRPEARPALPSR